MKKSLSIFAHVLPRSISTRIHTIGICHASSVGCLLAWSGWNWLGFYYKSILRCTVLWM
jgi:hypothetical protein